MQYLGYKSYENPCKIHARKPYNPMKRAGELSVEIIVCA